MSIYKAKHIEDLVDLYLPLRKKIPQANKRKKIIVIAGPTAVGKTDLSIDIAKILAGEIVSADSMQIYKNMDIGTAKASVEQRKQIPHHLIDIRNIKDNFNVSEYFREAHKACRQIFTNGKVPIVVGGSGFYIHAFLYGPPLGPPSNPNIRKTIEKQMDLMGPEALYEKLEMLDPEYATTITANDRHKIVRALEIITLTKKKVSEIPKPKVIESDMYNFRLWFLHYPKEVLYAKIDKRCDEMLKSGLIEEVKKLKVEGLLDNYSASQAIGYRQTLNYLNTGQTKEDEIAFINEFKQASKRYVKRQFAWFKKEPNFRWLDLSKISIEKAKEYILQDYEQND